MKQSAPTWSMMCGAAVSSGSPEMKHWRAEVVARLVREAAIARIRLGDRVGAVEERADPARARLEHAEPQRREAIERAERDERQERLLHALAEHDVVEELARAAEALEAHGRAQNGSNVGWIAIGTSSSTARAQSGSWSDGRAPSACA
jgi:hypothetical protein